MLKYGKNKKFNPTALEKLNIDRQTVEFVPEGSRVLDIGCATGFMGEYLKKRKKCFVIGIEHAKDEASQASKVLDGVIEGDVEDIKTLNKVKQKFDVIIASALIEHLKNPRQFLKNIKKLLVPSGFVVVTTPNIVHWSIRKKILSGNFEYEDYGILDNTHLKFFTTKTFPQVFREAGYMIDKFSIDPVGGGYPRLSLILSKIFPNTFAYQMLVKATPTK